MNPHLHLDDKRLFALLGGARDGAAHLAECDLCRDRLRRLRALRSAAAAASAPPKPDWSRTDEALRAEIRALCLPPRADRSSAWLPLTLAAAAVVAVIVAVVLGSLEQRGQTHPVESIALRGDLDHRPTTTAAPPTGRAKDPAGRLTAQKREAVPEFVLGGRDRLLTEGEMLATDAGQSVRIALDGGPAQLELAQQTAVAALSLNVEDPQIFIAHGVTDITTPLESQIVSLRVLAGGADFLINEADVTFYVRDEGLEVLIRQGDILAFEGETPLVLAKGRYARGPVTEKGQRAWTALPGNFSTQAPTTAQAPAVKERRIRNLSLGHLPLSAVRETMSRLKPALRRCYESALKRDSNLTLTPQARLEVSPDGRVVDVSIEGASEHPDMARCLKKIFIEARFRPPRGGSVRVVVPLKLYPRL